MTYHRAASDMSGVILNHVRVMAKLEPGGAQLSMLRVMTELRGRGITSELLCGSASPEGIALAHRHGAKPEIWGQGTNVQWTPYPGFAAWLGKLGRPSPLLTALWATWVTSV